MSSQILSELEKACYSDDEIKKSNARYILQNVLGMYRLEPDEEFKNNTKKIERLYNEAVAGERVVYTAEELKDIWNKLLESYATTGFVILLTAAGSIYLGKKLAYGIIDDPKIVDDTEQNEAKKKTLEL